MSGCQSTNEFGPKIRRHSKSLLETDLVEGRLSVNLDAHMHSWMALDPSGGRWGSNSANAVLDARPRFPLFVSCVNNVAHGILPCLQLPFAMALPPPVSTSRSFGLPPTSLSLLT